MTMKTTGAKAFAAEEEARKARMEPTQPMDAMEAEGAEGSEGGRAAGDIENDNDNDNAPTEEDRDLDPARDDDVSAWPPETNLCSTKTDGLEAATTSSCRRSVGGFGCFCLLSCPRCLYACTRLPGCGLSHLVTPLSSFRLCVHACMPAVRFILKNCRRSL